MKPIELYAVVKIETEKILSGHGGYMMYESEVTARRVCGTQNSRYKENCHVVKVMCKPIEEINGDI